MSDALRTPPQVKRRAGRRKVILTGKLVSFAGPSWDCSISDLDAEGARLKVDAFPRPPDEFHLVVLREGVAHLCQVRWRRERRIGVRFVETWDLRTAEGPRHYHLRRLWLDNAARAAPPLAIS